MGFFFLVFLSDTSTSLLVYRNPTDSSVLLLHYAILLNSCITWTFGWFDEKRFNSKNPLFLSYPWSSTTPKTKFSSVQSLSHVRIFATSWIAARQASLSITNSRGLLKLMPIESAMPSSHLTLCHPLLLLPPIPPSIRVFSNESTLCMRWPKYWSFSFSISPSVHQHQFISPMNTQDSSPLGWTGWISLQSKGLSRVFSNTTVQKHQFFGAQLSSQSNSHIQTWPLEKP